jgi:hypothetical protein
MSDVCTATILLADEENNDFNCGILVIGGCTQKTN